MTGICEEKGIRIYATTDNKMRQGGSEAGSGGPRRQRVGGSTPQFQQLTLIPTDTQLVLSVLERGLKADKKT